MCMCISKYMYVGGSVREKEKITGLSLFHLLSKLKKKTPITSQRKSLWILPHMNLKECSKYKGGCQHESFSWYDYIQHCLLQGLPSLHVIFDTKILLSETGLHSPVLGM